MSSLQSPWLDRAHGLGRLFVLLRAPGLPRVPGFLALMVLRWPGLLPFPVRWRVAAQGLGLVVAGQLAPVQGTGEQGSAEQGAAADVGRALQEIGRSQGRVIREQLGYGASPLECARAVALANRLFAIKARVESSSDDEARVVTPGCPWSRQEWWGPRPCGAFSRYEAGLTGGLNPEVSLHYESKRTRGDERCVGVYRWRPAANPTTQLTPSTAAAAPAAVTSHQDVDQAGDDGDQQGSQNGPAEVGYGHPGSHDPVEDL